MLQLRQLNLNFTFACAGALREDVKDQRRAVENFAVKNFFEIAALRRRKFVVENDRINFTALTKVSPFAGFTFANERGGVE
jgi:hypothetical protein